MNKVQEKRAIRMNVRMNEEKDMLRSFLQNQMEEKSRVHQDKIRRKTLSRTGIAIPNEFHGDRAVIKNEEKEVAVQVLRI